MPDVTTFDGLLDLATNYSATYPLQEQNVSAVTAAVAAGTGTGYRENLVRITLPSLPSGRSKYRAVGGSVTGSNAQSVPLVKLVPLATYTASSTSGTYTAGSTMPSRRIVGSDTALQLAAPLVVLVATVAVTATTPTITVTYTDQGGTSGNTATLVFPSNPTLHSAFVVNPHLASGDTGVQAVTAMTKSAGSAGTVTAYGLYPVHLSSSGTGPTNIAPDFWSSPIPKLSLQTSDNLTAYMFGSTATNTHALITVSGVADT